jgi:hypothetical protein
VGSGLQLFSIFDASTPADKRQQAATTKRTKDKLSDHDEDDAERNDQSTAGTPNSIQNDRSNALRIH